MSGATTPHYRVSALNKVTDAKGEIGAAWENENGSISIKLNPFVLLTNIDQLVITLFPIEGGGQPSRKVRVVRNAAFQRKAEAVGFRCKTCGCVDTTKVLDGCPNPECADHVRTDSCSCPNCKPF